MIEFGIMEVTAVCVAVASLIGVTFNFINGRSKAEAEKKVMEAKIEILEREIESLGSKHFNNIYEELRNLGKAVSRLEGKLNGHSK